jgi:hypothetical protein
MNRMGGMRDIRKPRGWYGLFVFCLLLPAIPPVMSEESLEQETISIEGNRGLPKTLYIAPWKQVGEPLEGEAFSRDPVRDPAPVERDILQRELELHREGYSLE